jgi:hypothetical protein
MFSARQAFFSGVASDPYWANVKLLVTARSGTIVDATGLGTIIPGSSFVTSSPSIINLNPYAYGQISGNLWWVNALAARATSGVFTTEWWWRSYFTVATSAFEVPWTPVNATGGGGSVTGPLGQIGTTNDNNWAINGMGNRWKMTTNYAYDQLWHHIAWTRNSSNVNTFFYDGVPFATTVTSSATNAMETVIQFGGAGAGPNASSCYWDDFRYTVGIVRYTGAFTPPSTPFPIG